MSRLMFAIKSGDSLFFWALFSVGMMLALLYSIDQMTGAELVPTLWRHLRYF